MVRRATMSGVDVLSEYLFPRALSYRRMGFAPAGSVREPGRERGGAAFGERHLQCVWFDPDLRPHSLRTTRGETIVVEDPGVWNLEEGPDFLGAALRIGTGRRRMSGDVEVHVHPAEWRAHGHGRDPRYAGVRIHVTYHYGATPAESMPPGAVHVALKDALSANPVFSFEDIDLTAYPYAVRATVPPCGRRLAGWSPDERAALLEAAGEERLRRKSERLAAAMRDRGADQALYEEVMGALGYKHNRGAFRKLAERLPLAELQREAKGGADAAYALLMGVAGLLPEKPAASWDTETRKYVRGLWDVWWKKRERWADRIMPRPSWHLGGQRPANRPERRLAAAAELFTRGGALGAQWLDIARREPRQAIAEAARMLDVPAEGYWAKRLSLRARPGRATVALIGPGRAEAVVNNVFVPFLAARGEAAPFRAKLLAQLPQEADNGILRQTAVWLFGPDCPPSLCRDGLRQQGLIQIFHDFCLNDRSRCASCALPELLQAYDGGRASGRTPRR